MGCDIHLVIEKRHKDEWVACNLFDCHNNSTGNFSAPDARERNYHRFAKLAGVRGEGPPARGIPEDASQTTVMLVDEWGVDGHSHSYVEIDEACRVFLATEYKEPDADSWKFKHPESHYFNVEPNERLGETFDDYRLIFWFDN